MPVPIQRGNPDAIVHPLGHGHHPHAMAGDHGQWIIRAAGGPGRLAEVGGKRHGRKDTAGRLRSCERGSDLAEWFEEGIVKRCIGDLTKSSIRPNCMVEPDSTLCRRGTANAHKD